MLSDHHHNHRTMSVPSLAVLPSSQPVYSGGVFSCCLTIITTIVLCWWCILLLSYQHHNHCTLLVVPSLAISPSSQPLYSVGGCFLFLPHCHQNVYFSIVYSKVWHGEQAAISSVGVFPCCLMFVTMYTPAIILQQGTLRRITAVFTVL